MHWRADGCGIGWCREIYLALLPLRAHIAKLRLQGFPVVVPPGLAARLTSPEFASAFAESADELCLRAVSRNKPAPASRAAHCRRQSRWELPPFPAACSCRGLPEPVALRGQAIDRFCTPPRKDDGGQNHIPNYQSAPEPVGDFHPVKESHV